MALVPPAVYINGNINGKGDSTYLTSIDKSGARPGVPECMATRALHRGLFIDNRRDSHSTGSCTVWLSIVLANVSDSGENTLRKIAAGPDLSTAYMGLALPKED
jgi:hypothetical protein